jgi:xylose isomerase
MRSACGFRAEGHGPVDESTFWRPLPSPPRAIILPPAAGRPMLAALVDPLPSAKERAVAATYRFSFGPWNISEGADPFGPPVRPTVAFAKKLRVYKELGFEGVQFHDDDAVPGLMEKTPAQVATGARKVRTMLDDAGLVAEFVAPRLWENPLTIDGGLTSNDPQARAWAIERGRRCLDVMNVLGCHLTVLWWAREGTYIRESKRVADSYQRLMDGINDLLAYDPQVRVAIEPKPNEPMDQAFCPTIGHALAMAAHSSDPARVGGLIESAHAILAGLDPADEMAFALSFDKLWSVHLNDQNGLKFDQDKAFGAANLRSAFNQVRVLEQANYAATGYFVGLDVKAMRTTKPAQQHLHLKNSKETFLLLVEKVRSFDEATAQKLIAARNYEALDELVLKHLMGAK